MSRRFAFALTALFLMTTLSQAAPPSAPHFAPPPGSHQYPSVLNDISPAHRTLRNYFAPPVSIYQHPSEPESQPPPYSVPTQPPWHPPLNPALDVPLLPRVLREPEPQAESATVTVRVPAGAEVWFNGVRTRQTGTNRVFESPPLQPGTPYSYTIKARWVQDGKEVARIVRIPVSAGSKGTADFTK